MPNKKLAVITVTYNNYETLKDFFKSLQSQSDQDFRLYLTDNSDEKKNISPQLINFTLTTTQNRGFAAGVNASLKKALDDGYTSFAVINNDTYFARDFITKTKKSLSRFPGSLIGGKIYYAPGFEYHKEKYQKSDFGRVIWYAGGHIDWDNVFVNHEGVDEIDQDRFDQKKETDFITGCLMIFDKEVVEQIGFFDESYFLYFEDVDWCERAKNQGIKLVYEPSVSIWHKVSQSTGGSGSSLHQKYQSRNRLKLGLKYAPFRTKLHLLKNYFLDSLKKR